MGLSLKFAIATDGCTITVVCPGGGPYIPEGGPYMPGGGPYMPGCPIGGGGP